MGRHNSSSNHLMRSPKEEQEVPESVPDINSSRMTKNEDEEIHIPDELESIWGSNDQEGDANLLGESDLYGDDLVELNFMEWDEFMVNNEDEEECEADEEFYNMGIKNTNGYMFEEERNDRYGDNKVIKREDSLSLGYGEDEEKNMSLKLNLNYQEVMDAWSNRGSLWATSDDYSSHSAANTAFMGEVPEMKQEKTRREAKVLRYKEKRQSRLFSKKIRYEVRKLNAEKRPRLKGRFVKRVPEKIFMR
ncbi:hypothetical protein MKW98_022034 [Papaver atlanticum]|uniref:CCT domain-containing protein n=1 Tax=Papaver atlanticum TaxID=357466 RepID=A0AAD4XZR4_9MAGN|nr:hypothetical protein MKW98_022034 [Papaver atlanticum]